MAGKYCLICSEDFDLRIQHEMHAFGHVDTEGVKGGYASMEAEENDLEDEEFGQKELFLK